MNRPVAIAAAAAAVVAAAVGGYLWLRSEPPEAPPREPGGSQVGALSPEPEGAGAGDPAAVLEEDSPGVVEVPAEPDGSPPAAQPSEPGGAVSADPVAASDAGSVGTPDTAGAEPDRFAARRSRRDVIGAGVACARRRDCGRGGCRRGRTGEFAARSVAVGSGRSAAGRGDACVRRRERRRGGCRRRGTRILAVGFATFGFG